MKKIIVFTLFIFFLKSTCAQTLKINVLGIRNDKGTIRLVFYNKAEDFDDEKPLFAKIISKAKLSDGKLSVTYEGLKSGTYGIAILDDENNNQKMDYGLALPKEGFGFSDYYHTGMRRPKFENFDFVFGKEDKVIEIKVRYL